MPILVSKFFNMENTNPTPPNTGNNNGGNNNRYITIEQFLTNSNTALTNALLADIEPLLLKRGIKKADVIAKQAEFAMLAQLNVNQKTEYGQSYQATADYDALENTLHEDYIDHLGLARIAFKNNVAAQTGLDLKGKRKIDEAGYCKQALQFYNGILESADYLAAMLVKGVDTTELTAMKAGYKNLEVLATKKSKEFGEAQAATAERNKLYEELGEWYSDFKATATIALRKHPQFREKLGWLER